MNITLTRAAGSIKQANPSRLNKNYQISLKKIIAILLIVIVAFSSYSWAIDKLNTEKNWTVLEGLQLGTLGITCIGAHVSYWRWF